METFKLITIDKLVIRFQLYIKEAPHTTLAWKKCLPFERLFYHAKVSGEEIWTPDGLDLTIPQENATIFLKEGEITLGPIHTRNKISNCIGIMYGEGKLLDCGNVFGKVYKQDLQNLKQLGKCFWTDGKQMIRFE